MLQRECDRQTARIGSEMRKHRRLDTIVTSVRTALRFYLLSCSIMHIIWYNFIYNFVGLTDSQQT